MQGDLHGERLHFLGIGGTGMAGLTRLAAARGARCSGSDAGRSPRVAALEREGFPVDLEQSPAALPSDCTGLVTSAAIPADHPQRRAAEAAGVRVVTYPELLGALMRDRTGVAVAGTHGKSSTTAMLAHVLVEGGLDPAVLLGANCPQIGGHSRAGRGAVMVAEACEYARSFHALTPAVAVILNVERDHLDCYPGYPAIVSAFAGFAANVERDGWLLLGHDVPDRDAIAAAASCSVETLGTSPGATWRVRALDGGVTELARGDTPCARWRSPLPGAHMAYNAAAAAVIAHRLGVGWNRIVPAIEGFAGLERRSQHVGAFLTASGDPVPVIDDYAHHPTEIAATLRAIAERHHPDRLVCAFQPHQHSRTRQMLDELAESLTNADRVVVTPIYDARDTEADRRSVSADALVDAIHVRGGRAVAAQSLPAARDRLAELLHPGDLAVTMGAGDVDALARDLAVETAGPPNISPDAPGESARRAEAVPHE